MTLIYLQQYAATMAQYQVGISDDEQQTFKGLCQMFGESMAISLRQYIQSVIQADAEAVERGDGFVERKAIYLQGRQAVGRNLRYTAPAPAMPRERTQVEKDQATAARQPVMQQAPETRQLLEDMANEQKRRDLQAQLDAVPVPKPTFTEAEPDPAAFTFTPFVPPVLQVAEWKPNPAPPLSASPLYRTRRSKEEEPSS